MIVDKLINYTIIQCHIMVLLSSHEDVQVLLSKSIPACYNERMKTISVSCALIVKNNTVLVAQRKNGAFDGLWEFPGGKIEEHESSEAALSRDNGRVWG